MTINSTTDKDCFEFLQVAIGHRDRLSCSTLVNDDWLKLFKFCKKQTLLGVGFHVVEKLHGQGIECPTVLKMKWMAIALKIEKRNAIMNELCRKLVEQYDHDGLQCCILKGQGNVINYPEYLEKRRNPGDIDVWCIVPKEGLPIAIQTGKNEVEYVTYYGRKAVREYVKILHQMNGNKNRPPMTYYHIDAPIFHGTKVEVHYRPSFCRAFIRNFFIQKWCSEQADMCMKNKTHLGFSVPPSSVNVVYQMCHLFSHYFHEGIGLRQLMDYYFALKVWHNDVMEREDLQSQGMWSEGFGTPIMSAEEVMRVLRSFDMGKFAAAVMWVLHEVFAMPTHYYICKPNEKEGRKLLAEIMQGGNFGQYDERGKDMKNGGTVSHAIWKLKRIMRLVSSYPEEALCEPFFRVYHLIWRMMHS